MVSARSTLVLALCGMAGCDLLTNSFDTNPFSGDAFPIYPETETGAIVLGLREAGSTGMHSAVLDVLAPITLIDRGAEREPAFDVRSYTLFGAPAPGEPLTLPRAQFSNKTVATLHPCSLDTPVCAIGTPMAPRPFDAVVGLDAFSSDALRLRLGTQELFVLPDIAGDDVRRSRACDAVLPQPFRGGGTLILGGAEVRFPSRRIAIDTCLAPNPNPLIPQRDRGIDALLVLSTAIGPSMINEATYARYLEIFPAEPALDVLPESSLLLPSGPVNGRMGSLPSIALVGNLPSNLRAPCRQVYASHLLERADCTRSDDCPCANDEVFCATPAIIELAPPSRIPVLIVSNSDPTLQALRTELRPDRPEVDGILGTSALGALELDIDFPHDRLLGRCIDTTTCGARAQLGSDRETRGYVTACLGDSRGPLP